ncbi:Penicillin-binding protein [Colletotrichum higginsianum IMI 349063]|uniref:Penicillin-binding protein n=2 Tax=Colletotrichum higginsianum TaxID=80884 RepID=A0A1B7XWQ5_COLHI|nr:Penicillin-binding protein [Colletotrichum higginsianum IMI 349063]OBR04185.1 Penicillin-binding protein [Colletotrichum higginsianum IMI 349063]TIC90205.1 Beta-lactamase [Colletotrichum higginsianum]
MAAAGAPGLSIGIINGVDGTTQSYHLGYRDVERQLRPNDQTRYNINSLSKSVVSVLTGMIIFGGQGQPAVTWSDPVRTWLPEFGCMSKDVRYDSNIVDLLSHRTGVVDSDNLWLGANNAVFLPKSEAIRSFTGLGFVEPFRTSFSYNNFGYEIVGQVLEKVTGKPLGKLLEDYVFRPLAMNRTSTSWMDSDDNEAKSYSVLKDLSPIEVGRPLLGNGTIMEAAGGVKSTLADLFVYYKALLQEINAQFDSGTDSTDISSLKFCRLISFNQARLPGQSIREQGYGLGLARGQLPGQLGRISANIGLGEEPIVGKGGPSTLVLYHHGCQPGSTSVVLLLPELKAGIVVLQNSLPLVDTPDLIGQFLLETLLQTPEPNDYLQLTRDFQEVAVHTIDNVREELEKHRVPGTKPRALESFKGRYWNELNNFCIDINVTNEGFLSLRLQGDDSEVYLLHHYHYDTFSWLMPHDEIIKRGRMVTFFGWEYYLMEFSGITTDSDIHQFHWKVMDSYTTTFTKEKANTDTSVS